MDPLVGPAGPVGPVAPGGRPVALTSVALVRVAPVARTTAPEPLVVAALTAVPLP